MSHCRSFCTFKTGPKIILLTVTLYLIFPLSHRNLGPLFNGRGVDVSYEFALTRRQKVWPNISFWIKKNRKAAFIRWRSLLAG